MNMRQLEAFRAIFQAGSVSGAADLLHVSQPSISRLIGDLESSVGYSLFARSRRGMVPTLEGRKLFEAVEKSFIGIDRLRDTARIIGTMQDGALSVGVIPSAAETVLPNAIARLHAKHPQLHVNVSVSNTESIINTLMMHEIDLGLVSTAYTLEGIEVLHEIRLEGVCLVPQSHPLAASKAPIDLGALRAEAFVSYERHLLDRLGLAPNFADMVLANALISTHSALAVAAIARETGRFAIVDPLTANTAIRLGGLVARRILQATSYGLAIIARKDHEVSIPERAFVAAHIAAISEYDTSAGERAPSPTC